MDFADSFRRNLGAAFNVCMYNIMSLPVVSLAIPSHMVWRGRTTEENQEQLMRLRASPHFVQEEETEKNGKPIHWFKLREPLLMDGPENPPPALWWLECPAADADKGGGLRGLVLHIPHQPCRVLAEDLPTTRFAPGGMKVWGRGRSAEMIIAEHKARHPQGLGLPV